MVSAIDATKPADGVLASKGDQRTNWTAAKSEIEAIQTEAANIRNALGLGPADTLFPELGGGNTPTGAQQFATIILALDAAITAAAASGGGAQVLEDLTNILSPSTAIRTAFQDPLDGGSESADFTFDAASQAGRFLVLNTATANVTMTLPDPATISRSDGWLCSVTATSGVNFGAITGPAGVFRYQSGIFGNDANQTTLYIGLSRTVGFRSLLDIYKDGPVYQVIGPARITETDIGSINAPQTVPGSALVDLSLLAATFPSLLNLGGSKQAGGGRNIERLAAGNTTLAQTDAGTVVVHTGAGTATWDVPDLSDGTTIEVENDGGDITFNPNGIKAVRGELTLSADASGAVRFTNGKIKFIGTVA